MARENNNRLYPVDGVQEIPCSWAKAFPEGAVRLNAEVSDIRIDQSGRYLNVQVSQDRQATTLAAAHVVFAVPAPIGTRACRNLLQWKIDALEKAHTPGSTLSIAADAKVLPEFKNWSFAYGNSVGYQPGFIDGPEKIEMWVEDLRR